MGGEVMIRRFQLLAAWWERRKIEKATQKVMTWLEQYPGEVISRKDINRAFPAFSDETVLDVWDELERQEVVVRHLITKQWIVKRRLS